MQQTSDGLSWKPEAAYHESDKQHRKEGSDDGERF
jgi:hypothetical protein